MTTINIADSYNMQVFNGGDVPPSNKPLLSFVAIFKSFVFYLSRSTTYLYEYVLYWCIESKHLDGNNAFTREIANDDALA